MISPKGLCAASKTRARHASSGRCFCCFPSCLGGARAAAAEEDEEEVAAVATESASPQPLPPPSLPPLPLFFFFFSLAAEEGKEGEGARATEGTRGGDGARPDAGEEEEEGEEETGLFFWRKREGGKIFFFFDVNEGEPTTRSRLSLRRAKVLFFGSHSLSLLRSLFSLAFISLSSFLAESY